ncbi:MAG: hypothetical protein ACPHIA_02250, partial [Alphaproteobacteria bacterium]
MQDEFNPVEAFRRAVGAAMRALSEKNEITVQFTSGPPAMEGGTARLPLPSRDLRPWEIAKIRGESDSLALRLRYHDEKIHRRLAPQLGEARAVFDALEQARIEALGANRMKGVAQNLSAAIEDYCLSRGFPAIERREQAPLADAARFLAREHFTGEATPEAGRKMLGFWRSTIESKAGADLMALAKHLPDQAAFAKKSRRILADLGLIEETAAENEEMPEEEPEESPSGQEAIAEADEEAMAGDDFRRALGEPEEGDAMGADSLGEDLEEDVEGEMSLGDTGETPGEPGRPRNVSSTDWMPTSAVFCCVVIVLLLSLLLLFVPV